MLQGLLIARADQVLNIIATALKRAFGPELEARQRRRRAGRIGRIGTQPPLLLGSHARVAAVSTRSREAMLEASQDRASILDRTQLRRSARTADAVAPTQASEVLRDLTAA